MTEATTICLEEMKFLKGFRTEENNKEINTSFALKTYELNKNIYDNLENIKSLRDLNNYSKAVEELYTILKVVKDEMELEAFHKTGQVFDYEKLRERYDKKKLFDKFPNFNIDRYFELLQNPISKIKNFRGETVEYDNYWIKKNLIAINQMIFDEMDIYILNIGKEGSGKSAWSSQQILYYYTFLKEVGLISYAYDIERMFFIDIRDFLDSNAEQDKADYFRIKCMDEGNQLNRSNFRDEDNQQFKYEMRTERKLLRIIILNMQQIGELDTSISLSRVNFIYDCKMTNKKRIGTLSKGRVDMYIIPRGEEIYSFKHKKIIKRNEVLNSFSHKLDKKKDYYIGLPRDLVVHKFKFDDVWGFDKEAYDDFVKDKMIQRRFQKKNTITDEQAYILLNKFKNLDKLQTFDLKYEPDKKMNQTIRKYFSRLKKYFEANPEKYNIIRNKYPPKPIDL